MKKTVLGVIAILFGVHIHAQHTFYPEKQLLKPGTKYKADQEKLRQYFEEKRKRNQNTSKAGGPVNAIFSYSDEIFTDWGTPNDVGSPLTFFVDPFFTDSLVVQDFGTLTTVPTHAVGATLDPVSPAYDDKRFDSTDSYTVDSVFLAASYSLATPVPGGGATGDILRIELVWGAIGENLSFFDRIGWAAGTFSGQTEIWTTMPLRYTGAAAHGDAGALDGRPQKVVIDYPLTTNDTSSFLTFMGFDIPDQLIPAGHKVGVSFKFIPGYSYNAGDVYFSGAGGSSSPTINHMVAWLYGPSNNTDNTAYGLDVAMYGNAPNEEYFSGSCLLTTNTRYNAWGGTDAFRNEYYAPLATGGYMIDFKLTGTSNFSVKEQNGETILFHLYPNPTKGIVQILFKQAKSGSYTLKVTDVLGREVHSKTSHLVKETETEQLNLSGLEKGIYLLDISHKGIHSTRRIIVE